MRKLFTSGLVAFAGMVSVPVAVSPLQLHTTAPAPPPDRPTDTRLTAIEHFFQRSQCPAARYASTFVEAADRYHLDWRLLPSLSFVESSGGKQVVNNNMFGWDNGKARFHTLQAGIHEVGYQLSHARVYRAKDLDHLLAVYNPSSDYGRAVKSVMRRIASEQ